MSFLEIIEKIQKKPEHIRRRILILSTIIIMAIIIAMWLINLTLSTQTMIAKEQPSSPSPFLVFWQTIKSSIENLYEPLQYTNQ